MCVSGCAYVCVWLCSPICLIFLYEQPPCLSGMCSNDDDDDVEQLTIHVISHTIAIMHGFSINICIISLDSRFHFLHAVARTSGSSSAKLGERRSVR